MMPEFNPKHLQRPPTPPTTLWFEFLLDNTLLEKHLKKADHDPSATELLALFLYQADLASTSLTDAPNNGDILHASSPSQTLVPPCTESRKMKALRLLALQLAAHLDWDLDVLYNSVPVAMVYGILLELLKAAGMDSGAGQLDTATLTDEAFFALQLYHRWVLRTAIQETFPVRPSKVTKVQVPGLLDPSVAAAKCKEVLIRMVRGSLPDSVAMLENILASVRTVRVPSMQCFGCLDETTHMAIHDWSKGVLISDKDLSCTVSYDLACCYFYEEKYDQAGKMFSRCTQLLHELSGQAAGVDMDRLQGYCNACGQMATLPPHHALLSERVEECCQGGYQGIVSLLLQDNQSRQLALSYRLAIADGIQTRNSGVYSDVCICNVIRQSLDGSTYTAEFTQHLQPNSSQEDLFVKACADVLESCSERQQINIKYLLRYVCHNPPDGSTGRSVVVKLLAISSLKGLFSAAEVCALQAASESTPRDEVLTVTATEAQSSLSSCIRLAEVERTLLTSYVASTVKDCVHKLLNKMSKRQLIALNDKWRVPRELSQVIEGLPIPLVQVCTYVLVAKAFICCQLKLFDTGRDLLAAADATVKDISYKLSKLLRNEVLRCDLLRYRADGRLALNQSLQDLLKKVKTSFTSLQLDHDMKPRLELITECTSLLVNMSEWEYLCGVVATNNYGCLTLSYLLCSLCRELPNVNNARKSGRELWDAIVLIGTAIPGQKGGVSGGQGVTPRHPGCLSQEAFTNFIVTLTEPVVLSVLISALCKLYSVIDDTIICEIASDYQTLWPTTLANASVLSASFVSDAVSLLLDHALSLQPNQPSWLRTTADLYYAHSEHSQALKFYLLVGVVTTDFFTEPVSNAVYDDQVYKKMIKCCSYLQCHTQVAVLCQMLTEVDYSTAFKALQETVCHDAMDGYYDYVWDVTLLEFIIHLHNKRGEIEKRNLALSVIGNIELNSSNRLEILYEAAKLRKANFLRAMAKQYL